MATTPGTDAHPHGALHHDDVAHEHSDISVRGVIWFVITLAVICAVIQVAVWGLFRVFDRYEATNDPFVSPYAVSSGALPPAMSEPVLQTTPWLDLKQFRADEDAYLNSYGWVDQKSGVAHLPIDKAKELLLQRGLPSRAEQQADPREGTRFFAYGEASGGRAIPAGGADLSSAPSAAPIQGTTPAPAAKGPGDGATKAGGGR